MNILRNSFLVLFLACGLTLYAHTALKMREFSMADGLPSNTITMLTTADNGMLWIATWNGLCNYDGYRFNSFVSQTEEERVLSGNRLHFIVPDTNGDVWITSSDDHLFVYDSKDRKYIDYQKNLEQWGLAGFEVNYMHSLSNGAVWILGKNGQNIRFQNGTHKVSPTSLIGNVVCSQVVLTEDGSEWFVGENIVRRNGCKTEVPIKSPSFYYSKDKVVIVGDRIVIYNLSDNSYIEKKWPIAVSSVYQSLQMPDGRIIIATNAGVYAFVEKNSLFEKESALVLTNLYCDKKERLWSVLDNGTAMMIDTKKHTTKILGCVQPDDWPKITTERSVVHEDSNGLIWVFLQGKTICMFDEDKDDLTPINLRTIFSNIPAEMNLSKIISDHHGNLWFCGHFSLYQLTFSNYFFNEIPIVAGEETRSMFVDGDNGYWIGTRNGHIVVLDEKGNRMGYLSSKGTLSLTETKFCENGIYAIYKDPKQRIWIGTRGSGLYVIDTNGEIKNFLKSKGSKTCGDNYFDIQSDGNGHIWFTTYRSGMMYLDLNAEKDAKGNWLFHYADNCKNLKLLDGNINKIRRVVSVKDSLLLFSSSDGVIALDPRFKRPEEIMLYISSYIANDKNSLLSRDVMQTLPCMKSSKIYVATLGGGMQTIASDNLLQNSLKFNYVPILSTNTGTIRGLVEDLNGKIWIASENAIHTLSIEGQNQRSYTSVDWGKEIEFCEARPVYNPKDNSIIMGTLGGVIKFRPEEIVQKKFISSLVFTGIRYQGQESIVPLVGNKEIELPLDNHNAVIFFAALDYVDNSQIRYAYRIKELDKAWNYVGTEHCAPLSNLPSGHYTLEVRSTNNEGVWMDNIAEQRIYVEPTFWQTPWAWFIYLIVFVFILYDIIFLIQLKNAHRMEKEINKRQLHFFTDISHQLRTPLTLIGGPVAEVLNTEHLSEKAQTYLRFVENNANKMLELVNKTLDLKKLKVFNESISSTPISEDLTIMEQQEMENTIQNFDNSDLTILIVEDNDELRYFLCTTLSEHYNILEASNGRLGLQMAAEHQPDFIITDVMMPEMDGITMIRRIKSDDTICHIPIIILSARTADVYRIEGLKEGADDYITKPFSVSYLQVRVESIVRQRRLLQKTWREKLLSNGSMSNVCYQQNANAQRVEGFLTESQDENAGMTPQDVKFANALTKFIEQNIANDKLRIDDIASAMCMSRTVLYGKTKAIYGDSPNDIVRQIRIAKACAILREDYTKSVTEIAFSVGFSEPKYFARCFKQSVGMTPTEYRKQG